MPSSSQYHQPHVIADLKDARDIYEIFRALDVLSSDVQQYMTRDKEKQARILILENELEEIKKTGHDQLGSCQLALNEEKHKTSVKERENRSLKNDVKDLEAENTSLRKKLDESKQQFEYQRSLLSKSEQMKAEQDEQIRMQKSKMKNSLTAMQKLKADQDEQTRKQKGDLDHVQNMNAEKDERLRTMKTDLANLQKMNLEMSERGHTMEVQKMDQQNEWEKVNGENETLRQAKRELETELGSIKERIAEIDIRDAILRGFVPETSHVIQLLFIELSVLYFLVFSCLCFGQEAKKNVDEWISIQRNIFIERAQTGKRLPVSFQDDLFNSDNEAVTSWRTSSPRDFAAEVVHALGLQDFQSSSGAALSKLPASEVRNFSTIFYNIINIQQTNNGEDVQIGSV